MCVLQDAGWRANGVGKGGGRRGCCRVLMYAAGGTDLNLPSPLLSLQPKPTLRHRRYNRRPVDGDQAGGDGFVEGCGGVGRFELFAMTEYGKEKSVQAYGG